MDSENAYNHSTHIIDPDGEVLIILRDAKVAFASTYTGTFADRSNRLITDSQHDLDALTEQLEQSTSPVYQGVMEQGLRAYIRVSAKHISFASPVFKELLTGDWKESVTFREKGSVELTMEGWDLEALLILLRAIHGLHDNVPRKLNLEMLAKIAVLLDYYQCKEAVGFFTDSWVSTLEDKVPTGFLIRDLTMWIWVSWFFRLPIQFKQATSTAMSLSNGSIHSLGLPIPSRVLVKADMLLTLSNV